MSTKGKVNKNTIKYFTLLLVWSVMGMAAKSAQSQTIDQLVFGNDSTLDVISWNVEWFPKNGLTTINYVAEIIEALDADIIAFQEIDENFLFEQMLQDIDDYQGFVVENEYSGLAYVYKSETVEITNQLEIFVAANREFPRAPLVLEFTFMEEEYVLINNHLKCCGDGNLDLTDSWDEETRRLDACVLLDQYIDLNYPDDKVFVVGDFNDILTDPEFQNVFDVFFQDEENYLFTDLEIAQNEAGPWSYPSWPSHLDHILITEELFESYGNPLSSIETITVDDFFEGAFDEYDANVSDHRPMGLKIEPNSIIISVEESLLNTERKLVQITDLTGRIVEEKPNTLLIYFYDDGSIEKKIIEE